MKKIEETLLTPKLLAEGFWELDDKEQAQFFAELYSVTKSAVGDVDSQWYYMGKAINKDINAKKTACSMMVYIFNHATNYLENAPD